MSQRFSFPETLPFRRHWISRRRPRPRLCRRSLRGIIMQSQNLTEYLGWKKGIVVKLFFFFNHYRNRKTLARCMLQTVRAYTRDNLHRISRVRRFPFLIFASTNFSFTPMFFFVMLFCCFSVGLAALVSSFTRLCYQSDSLVDCSRPRPHLSTLANILHLGPTRCNFRFSAYVYICNAHIRRARSAVHCALSQSK